MAESETNNYCFYKDQRIVDVLEYSTDPDDPEAKQMIAAILEDGTQVVVSVDDENLKIERAK